MPRMQPKNTSICAARGSYYRARYYDPQNGRFFSEDPLEFAAGVNFYRYAGNDPIDRTDPLGLWDTYTHGALIWNALAPCGVDHGTIYKLQQYSAKLDKWMQSPDSAFMHSMRAPLQNPQDALRRRDEWIVGELNYSAQNGGLLEPLAYAMHTGSDATSPAHMHNGVPNVWPSWPNVLFHGNENQSIETWENMTPEIEQQNIAFIRAAYEFATKTKLKCECNK